MVASLHRLLRQYNMYTLAYDVASGTTSLTKSTDVECEEHFVLHEVEDIEAVLDLARDPNKRNGRYSAGHGRKMTQVPDG